MTYPGEERRKADPVQEQIEKLILAANDPKDKAFLLIMNRIAASLDANTLLTQGLSNDFKLHMDAFNKHEAKERELLSQGRGGVKVVVYLFGALQLIGGYLINNTLIDIKESKLAIIAIERRVAIHEEYHKKSGDDK